MRALPGTLLCDALLFLVQPSVSGVLNFPSPGCAVECSRQPLDTRCRTFCRGLEPRAQSITEYFATHDGLNGGYNLSCPVHRGILTASLDNCLSSGIPAENSPHIVMRLRVETSSRNSVSNRTGKFCSTLGCRNDMNQPAFPGVLPFPDLMPLPPQWPVSAGLVSVCGEPSLPKTRVVRISRLTGKIDTTVFSARNARGCRWTEAVLL